MNTRTGNTQASGSGGPKRFRTERNRRLFSELPYNATFTFPQGSTVHTKLTDEMYQDGGDLYVKPARNIHRYLTDAPVDLVSEENDRCI